MVTMLQFKNVIENKRKPIKQILDSALQERITANRAILKYVIKTVVICGITERNNTGSKNSVI